MSLKVLPTRRNLKFNLDPTRALEWHEKGKNVALFLNTLSVFFPAGERFFIDSVRHYRKQITDAEMKKAVTAFIGQEAMHTREHEEYNEAIKSHDIPIDAQEAFVEAVLKTVQKATPDMFHLAATIALEHLTAILADGLLSLPNLMKESDIDYKTLWQWHALEECEHKAVAFDVWQTAIGTDDDLRLYVLRSATLVIATSIFFAIFIPYYLHNVRIKGGLFDLKGWINVYKQTWGKEGIFRYITPAWFDWFKRGFHPWDHDNSHYLTELKERLAYVIGQVEAA